MTRLSVGGMRIAITVATVLSLLAFGVSWWTFETRASIADARSARAVAGVDQLVERLADQQQADRESDCRILNIGRLKPSDPRPTTALGRARANEYEREYRARGCPP
jgi:hypothetical protein